MSSNLESFIAVKYNPPCLTSMDFRLIREGSTEIQLPIGARVFFNKVQELNRDLSIAALKVLAEEYSQEPGENNFRILEALSATGLRSIRYAKEVPKVTEIIANDISSAAVDSLNKNISRNGVAHIVKTSNADAVKVMFDNRFPEKRFQVVDLDPYGSPTKFLDTAVQCVEDGGVLLVTCTDMAVLCGNSPETCYLKYGSLSLKNNARHEMALRITLNCIQAQASKYKRYIVPLLSVSVDFYIRVIVKIFTSPVKCKENASKLSMVYSCSKCDSTTLQRLGEMKMSFESPDYPFYTLPTGPIIDKECNNCGAKHYMGGPIWSAPIHDPDFVERVIQAVKVSEFGTKKRLLGLLNVISEELLDVPLYYNLPKLCSNVKALVIPMMMFRSAVLNGGYRISFSHASKQSVKTDAPNSFVWDIIREWAKEKIFHRGDDRKNFAILRILVKPLTHEIDFTPRPDANPLSRKNKMLRYPPNPAPFWGPGTKSSTNPERSEKSLRNQNKRRGRRTREASDGAAAMRTGPN